MNQKVYPPQASRYQAPADTFQPHKVQVTLLDQDNLPLARGTAVLPLLLGGGIFWPTCPMPTAERLLTAKCFALPTGETMNLKSLILCPGSPPRYEFWVRRP